MTEFFYSDTHFLWRQGAHDSGTLFLFRTTLNSGDCAPALEDVVEGGVGVILGIGISWILFLCLECSKRVVFRIALAAGANSSAPSSRKVLSAFNQIKYCNRPPRFCNSKMLCAPLVQRAYPVWMRLGSESACSISKDDLSPPPYHRCVCAAMHVVNA